MKTFKLRYHDAYVYMQVEGDRFRRVPRWLAQRVIARADKEGRVVCFVPSRSVYTGMLPSVTGTYTIRTDASNAHPVLDTGESSIVA